MAQRNSTRTEEGPPLTAERRAPPAEGRTAVGPGAVDPCHPETPAPGETRRTEGTGSGRDAGMADDLGTSGSRGTAGARDEYDRNALPGDGPGSRHSQVGRGQDTAR